MEKIYSNNNNKSQITGVVFDEQTQLHDEEYNVHLECPQRVTSILKHLKEQKLLEKSQEYPNLEIVEKIKPLDRDLILGLYSKQYIDEFEKKWQDTIDRDSDTKTTYFDGDTYCNEYTVQASYLSAGSNILAVDKIMKQEWLNSFCIVRPPGHHSGYFDQPSGFCYLNNVVIAAKYALEEYSEQINRVLILDWDVHYGDGTAKLVEEDDQIMLISIHQYDYGYFYPGTGSIANMGKGKGKGYNINIPWNIDEGTPGNQEYIYCFERIIAPILKEFSPDLILISSGFDSCKNDLIGQCMLDIDGYAYMTKRVQDLSNGRVIVNLEGGYNLDEIPKAAEGVLRGLMREDLPIKNSENKLKEEEILKRCNPNQGGLDTASMVINNFEEYWSSLEKDPEALKIQERVFKIIDFKDLLKKLKNSVKELDNQIYKYTEKLSQEEIQEYQKIMNENNELIEIQQKLLNLEETEKNQKANIRY